MQLYEISTLKSGSFHLTFFRQNSADDVLSPSEIQNVCDVLRINSLEEKQVGIVRLSFFPHKKGLPFAKARMICTSVMETLLEISVESFFKYCFDEWERQNESPDDRRDIFPIYWRMFTDKS